MERRRKQMSVDHRVNYLYGQMYWSGDNYLETELRFKTIISVSCYLLYKIKRIKVKSLYVHMEILLKDVNLHGSGLAHVNTETNCSGSAGRTPDTTT